MKPPVNRLEYQQLEQIPPQKIETVHSQSAFRSKLKTIWQFLVGC